MGKASRRKKAKGLGAAESQRGSIDRSNVAAMKSRLGLGEEVDYSLLSREADLARVATRKGVGNGVSLVARHPKGTNPRTGPEWAGAFSFNRSWTAAFDCLTECPILGESEIGGEPRDVLSPSQMASFMALTALRGATPVFIGEEQLKALPDLDEPISEIVKSPGLPFPATYLDFSSARGPAEIAMRAMTEQSWDDPVIEAMFENVTLLYHGALIFEAEPQRTGGQFRNGQPGEQLNAGLTVIPFCSTLVTPDGERRIANRGDGRTVPEATPLGAVCFGSTPKDFQVIHGDFSHPMSDLGEASGAAPLALSVARVPLHHLEPSLPGYADVGEITAMREYIKRERAGDIDNLDELHLHFIGQAQMLMVLVEEALKALHLLNAANIVVEPMNVSRQQRRQAERKGGQIAMTVRVTRSSKVPPKGPASYSRDYSHRFARRGHYRHVTKGKHAKADYVKACSRRDPKTHELTCPDGCRREWVPEHVVGPEHLPYVPKTRVWPGVDRLMDEAS